MSVRRLRSQARPRIRSRQRTRDAFRIVRTLVPGLSFPPLLRQKAKRLPTQPFRLLWRMLGLHFCTKGWYTDT